MKTEKVDIIEEFIQVLQNPTQLKTEKRFKLLELCYLIKNNHPKYVSFYEKIKDESFVRKIDAIIAMGEVDRLHKLKDVKLSTQKDIDNFINHHFNM